MLSKEALREVIADQRRRKMPSRIVEREALASMRKGIAGDAVVILSGVRRCGKSTLLHAIRNERKDGDYFLNFDDERLIDFSVGDFQMLTEVFLEMFGKQESFYFDEIQNVSGWERFVRRLHDDGKKVFITGSNASMLSRELGTHLTGRYVQTSLFPFSFLEFLSFRGKSFPLSRMGTEEKVALRKEFLRYVRLGGFPEYLVSENKDRLTFLYENILYRDIVVRHNLPDARPLKETAHFCASNVGKEMSYNSIKRIAGLENPSSIREYFEYMEDSFLAFVLKRFDYSVKRQAYFNKKAYFIDTGLANTVGFRFSRDRGRFLENVIFLDLKARGKELFFHKNKRECDFLVREKGRVQAAIQVAQSLAKPAIYERELEGLLEAMEAHHLREGYILTEEEFRDVSVGKKRISIRPISHWLLDREGCM